MCDTDSVFTIQTYWRALGHANVSVEIGTDPDSEAKDRPNRFIRSNLIGAMPPNPHPGRPTVTMPSEPGP